MYMKKFLAFLFSFHPNKLLFKASLSFAGTLAITPFSFEKNPAF